jgi:hypothetical protein
LLGDCLAERVAYFSCLFENIIFHPSAISALRDRIGEIMPSRTARNLEIIRLGPPLRRFARGLQPDPNASSFLVHKALSSAFAEPPELRPSDELEASLRGDIARLFADQASSPRGPAGFC